MIDRWAGLAHAPHIYCFSPVSGRGVIHSRALRIRRMQNIDFPKLNGPAMMAVNGCMNFGSIVSKFIIENLARNGKFP